MITEEQQKFWDKLRTKPIQYPEPSVMGALHIDPKTGLMYVFDGKNWQSLSNEDDN